MSTVYKETIIRQSGEVVARTTTEVVCELPDSFLEGLSVQKPFTIPYFSDAKSNGYDKRFDGMFGNTGLYISNKQLGIVTRVHRLRFHTPVQVLDDKFVTPLFNNKDSTEPFVQFNWEVPENMALYYVNAMVMMDNQNARFHKAYLVAVDGSALYRLPTSNVYDDCAICMGEFNPGTSSAFTIHGKCLEQFMNSPWNSDLYIGKGGEKSALLFRFMPKVKGEGFTQAAVAEWKPTCAKVSLELLNQMKGLYV